MGMNLILFDDDSRDRMLPLVYTRPVCELRVGILTIREKWELLLDTKASYITQDYLSKKYPIQITDRNLVINGALLPTKKLVELFSQLETNQAVIYNDELLAANLDDVQFKLLEDDLPISELSGYDISKDTSIQLVDELWKIYTLNGSEIENDFSLITKDRTTQPISHSNTIIGTGRIFLEEGAIVEGAIMNSNNGSIYIGKDAEVMEGSMIRGGFALCANSKVKMGAKVYGPTTVGPWSKIGGEVNNSVILGYSNKGHDGYMGNSVIGEWCNIGADTQTSNLKNNYTDIKLWNYQEKRFIQTGEQFCGLIMADHAKSGISIMFNTGTVVGVASNIFGTGYPRNFIPSFAWGSIKGYETYKLDKAFDTMERVMKRRGMKLNELDKEIIETIYSDSAKYRSWEK
ncbi:glucose-1-phosphate thymidylyltransferase [Portibacter lacus]|uniref:Glucose-1-phosphate thymidylyltransferase n=2 Tax=Portibacter lacus TaxID=1099794 RepID=A0AA37WEU9_9BACT|nr:glucose-1-phosphate thymidylyltransferase [Portibacter lacus]